MNERARYRDFYDFYLITEGYNIDMDETIRLVQQKEMRKPVTKASILRNWKIATGHRRDEIELIYYRDDIFDNEQEVEGLLAMLPFDTIHPGTTG